MQYAVKDLPKNAKEVRVTVAAEELKPFMDKAAAEMSRKAKIEGFRPGKASYEIVAKRFGEMTILEEALPAVVRTYLVEIVTKEKFETVGEPSINVEKAAPGNEAVFTAKLSLLPKVLKLADVRKLEIAPKDVTVKDEDVERAVADLRKMRSTEHEVEREARVEDKVIIDMRMTRDKVPVEGGNAKGHAVYLSEKHYIPGLAEKLVGMRKGETREFVLKFPEEHYNKQLAGKDVEFSVDLTGVHEIRHPEATDEFAKSLGQESMAALRGLLRKNLQEEADLKESQRQELAALEALIKESKFEEIPDRLVEQETHKMLHELEHSISLRGGTFEDYLKSVKKTKEQLMLDFAPEALKRVKSAILVREIGKREGLEPTDAEVLDEQMKLINLYKDDGATQERIRSEDGEEYIRYTLRNRKVLEFIRKTAVR